MTELFLLACIALHCIAVQSARVKLNSHSLYTARILKQVSAQSFPPPPSSLAFSFSISNLSRAPSPCLSCPPSCCPIGSSLEAPSKAAVVSEEVGGGGSDAGPVFTPAAEFESARERCNRGGKSDLDYKMLDSVPLFIGYIIFGLLSKTSL